MSAELKSQSGAITWRMAAATDAALLCELLKNDGHAAWSLKVWQQTLASGAQCELVLCAGQIIGCYVLAGCSPDLEVQQLVVMPAWRRRGVGSIIMQRIFSCAQQQAALALHLEVRSSNHPAIALYQRYGFSQVGIRRNYYKSADRREDALLLSCSLAKGGLGLN